MSKAHTIARLESLLARIHSRAEGPRVVAAARVVAAPAAPGPVPVMHAPPPREAPAVTEAEIVVDVEVQVATPETVLAVVVEEEPAPPAALESREQLVAAEPAPVAESAPVEIEVEEEVRAPISSRRPIPPQPEEQLAAMAFGAEEPQPARHTPPPESGRLLAAPAADFDAEVTEVREAQKVASPVPLVPHATAAVLAPSDVVADVVGAPRPAVPATFVAVLDASLAL